MKNIDLKKVGVFTLVICSVILLASCSGESDKEVSRKDDMKKTTIHEKVNPKEEMDKAKKEEITKEVMDEIKKVEDNKESDTDIMEKMEKEELDSEVKMLAGKYTDYSEDILSSLEGNIVLFFHADWCPACVAAEKEILSSGLPSDINILKVNYDSSTELKKKYEVLTQTTFVQIDKDGNMIKKWVGARDVEDIQDRLK